MMKGVSLMMVLFFIVMSTIFQCCFSAASFPLARQEQSNRTMAANDPLGPYIVLPIEGHKFTGNDGKYYNVTLEMGNNQPKTLYLVVDSGSSLTWVECNLPCKPNGCRLPKYKQYNPQHSQRARCSDPLCNALGDKQCANPEEDCKYRVQYIDGDKSEGLLVKDNFRLTLNDNSRPEQAGLHFGCGYDQFYKVIPGKDIAGLLGLGRGEISIASQLKANGVTKRNVTGHCLARQDRGFLFIGEHPVIYEQNVSWTGSNSKSDEKLHMSGQAKMLFDGNRVILVDQTVAFDSGSSFTFFYPTAYEKIKDLIIGSLKGTPLRRTTGVGSFKLCWQLQGKTNLSLPDVEKYFKNISLYFNKKAQLVLKPADYLIIPANPIKVCLGIIEDPELIRNRIIIGAISMQDKVVIYVDDQEKAIGWKDSIDCKS